MASSNPKQNSPTMLRMTLSRSSAVTMMRGVNCPLAICTATSSEPKVKTRNDRCSVISISIAESAPSSLK